MVKPGLDAGSLDCLVTFQVKTVPDTTDGFGDPQEEWSDSFTEWVDFQQVGTREFPQAYRMNAETTGRVVMRYRAGIDPALHRIVYDGRTWNILGAADPDGRKTELRIEVSEIR